MEHYCLYLRKSRADIEAENKGEMETLARHEKILLDLAQRMHISIEQIYKEIVSGETISARPIIKQLLYEVEQGKWNGVLVMEIERLARGDTIDQGIVARAFQIGSTKIITPIKVYDPNNEFDEEYFEFGLFMSRREYKTINRRLQQGRLQSVKEGKYVGSLPPYGYVKKKLEKTKGYTLEPHPEQADVVKMIFDLYVNGELRSNGSRNRLGASLITRKLNDLKIPSAKGGMWVVSTVHDMLINPVYAGKIRWNWKSVEKKIVDGIVVKSRPKKKLEDCYITDGLHPAIITYDLFMTAKQLNKCNPPTPIPKDKTVKNPLAGLIVCGKCGRKMVRRPYRPYKNINDSIMCTATYCKNVSSELHCVEEHILYSLADWAGLFEAQIENENNSISFIQIKEKTLSEIDKELAQLKIQLENTYNMLEQDIYTLKIFVERKNYLDQKIDNCNKEYDKLSEELNHEIQVENYKNNIKPKSEKILEIYNTLESAAEKNSLLKEVIKKVVYNKNVNGRWHNSPDNFEIDIYPSLPLFGE